MSYKHTFHHAIRRWSPPLRERGRIVRKMADRLGFVYFGAVNQHEDDHSAIRGFSASLTHVDAHYAVGTYEGYNIRVVNRSDILHTVERHNHHQTWTIIEIDLSLPDVPHVFFVPTGQESAAYARLFATQPYMLPLNSHSLSHNKSPEFHGRYQLLGRTTHSHTIATLLDSPTIVGIGARFWPHGIELQHGKLYVYLSEKHLTLSGFQIALTAGLWLADTLNDRHLK